MLRRRENGIFFSALSVNSTHTFLRYVYALLLVRASLALALTGFEKIGLEFFPQKTQKV